MSTVKSVTGVQDDAEMLKWLDALIEIDPTDDAAILDQIENKDEDDMQEAVENGVLDQE